MEASHANHRAYWRQLARICGGESVETPGGLLVRTGVPGPGWNLLQLEAGVAQEAALEQAGKYFAGHGTAWRLYAGEESAAAEAFAARLGAVAKPRYPILNRPCGPAGDPGEGELELSTAGDLTELREFLDCAGSVYGFDPALLGPMVHAGAFDDPALRFHLGRVGGRVVAISLGVRHEDTVGIYFVGVREDHRRRGFGRLVTEHAIGAEPDATTAVLQATPAGLPVYRDMGFTIVAEYRYWNVG
ncbi:hypothetical protein GCM10025331_81920 [Actinoplanes utahensis]|nr:hypothetical protein Aut01nite_52460 [Actinoplanes utahensis]